MVAALAPNRAEVFEEYDLIASICRESFFDFVKEFWETIIQEAPVWNWHIPYLCDELQIMAERVFKNKRKTYDLIINIPPGSTKSTICSVMFPIWVWTRKASCRSICASYSYPLAMELSRRSRDIVQSEKFIKCFPTINLRDDQNTKGHFANTKGGMRYSVGIGGSVTGMHGHFLLVDDPLNPQEALSEAELKACNSWMQETLPTRKVEKKVTPTILIMQRLHQNDPSGARLEKWSHGKGGRVKHICLPAEDSKHVNPPELRERYVKGLLDPVRLDKEVLKDAKVDLGEYGYSGQFRQHPVPLGGGMFKTARIHISEAPMPRFFVRMVRYWDKAGTAGGGAFTVGCLMALHKDGSFWVLDIVRGQWDSWDREEIIKTTAIADGKRVLVAVEQEGGSGGKESAEGTVRRLAGYRVRIDKPVGDKAMRADPFSTQVNAGNVYLKKGAAWISDYLEEMRYFPASTYKDQIDASSGAFAQLTKPLPHMGAL